MQSETYAKGMESITAEKADKAKQLAEKTASETKLTADVTLLKSEKVTVAQYALWLTHFYWVMSEHLKFL